MTSHQVYRGPNHFSPLPDKTISFPSGKRFVEEFIENLVSLSIWDWFNLLLSKFSLTIAFPIARAGFGGLLDGFQPIRRHESLLCPFFSSTLEISYSFSTLRAIRLELRIQESNL